MQTHTGEKPFSCKVCVDLSFHLSQFYCITYAHTEDRKHIFVKSYLSIHMGKCTVVRLHFCKVFDSFFPGQKNLKNHIQTHEKEKLHSYAVCGSSYKQIE